MNRNIKRLILGVLPFALAFGGLSVHAQSSMVTLLLSAEPAQVGVPAHVNVLIDCRIDACSAANFSVRFDANALRVDNIVPGGFPGMTGNTPYLIRSDIENATGTFTASYVTIDNGYSPVTGTGILMVITFTARQSGEFHLEFMDASVASLDGRTVLEPQTVAGILFVAPAVIHQTLTIRAESGRPDIIHVNALADGVIISRTLTGDDLIVEVIVNDGQPSSFEIDAPGHLACTVSDSKSRQIMLYAGDLNDDGRIDANDGVIGDTARHDEPDLNGDHQVNIYELIQVGRNFGMSSGDC